MQLAGVKFTDAMNVVAASACSGKSREALTYLVVGGLWVDGGWVVGGL
jgi:hypothetical protein